MERAVISVKIMKLHSYLFNAWGQLQCHEMIIKTIDKTSYTAFLESFLKQLRAFWILNKYIKTPNVQINKNIIHLHILWNVGFFVSE